MGGGADDLLARQASQPAYSLVQEGGELVGIDPVGLRPRVAQLGGFRIESKKVSLTMPSFSGSIFCAHGCLRLRAKSISSSTSGMYFWRHCASSWARSCSAALSSALSLSSSFS